MELMSLDKQLDRMVTAFVSDLRRVISAATRDEIAEAMRKALAANGARGAKTVRGMVAMAAGRGRKRSPEQMARQQARLYEYIKANPGQRMEQIVQGIGLGTNLLQPLIKRLVDERQIKAKGKARGTTYTAA
jgi:hypothetical protein